MIEDREFDILVAEERHKQLITALRSLIEKPLSADRTDEIREAIEEQTSTIEGLLSTLITKIQERQPINIATNQDKVVTSIKEAFSLLQSHLGDLKKVLSYRPREWHWEITRDEQGFISGIITKAK